MTRRRRKLIGAVVMIAFVCVYSLVVMAIAQGRIQDAPKFAQTIFYFVGGLLWVLPLLPLIRWMEKGEDGA